MRLLATVLLCSGVACSSNPNAAAAATGALVVGLGASGVSRAQGGCYAECIGTDLCNVTTGWCEPNPCGQGCGAGNRCDTSGPLPRCVADRQPEADLRTSPLPPPPVPWQ